MCQDHILSDVTFLYLDFFNANDRTVVRIPSFDQENIANRFPFLIGACGASN
jgi:hypothetical protein